MNMMREIEKNEETVESKIVNLIILQQQYNSWLHGLLPKDVLSVETTSLWYL